MSNSYLFYQSRHPRPFLDHDDGIYMWDQAGKRYLDGSSGAMVSNIGHSNPAVLAAMREQMERSTFGYRLHFQTEPSEQLAGKLAAYSPEGMNKVFFVSGGVRGRGEHAQAGTPACGHHRSGQPLQGHFAHARPITALPSGRWPLPATIRCQCRSSR